MVNTREYEYADVTVFIGGRDVVGLRGIKYSAKQEKEALFGKGNKPLSIQHGNKTYEGEITVTQSELLALQAAGGGSILDLKFNVVVNYGNPSKGDMISTEELIGVEFTEENKEMKQGDKFMECTLPIVYLDQRQII